VGAGAKRKLQNNLLPGEELQSDIRQPFQPCVGGDIFIENNSLDLAKQINFASLINCLDAYIIEGCIAGCTE
jgi:hypothetical protein